MARLQREAEKRAKDLQTRRGEDGDDDSGGNTDSEGHDEEEEEFDPQEALLFVYVCTHAAEISKGKAIAGTYLVTSDTSWTSKEALSRSALRLETLTSVIADIQVLLTNVVCVNSLSILPYCDRKVT